MIYEVADQESFLTALRAAQDGDEIRLSAGEYYGRDDEDEPVESNAAFMITGAGASVDSLATPNADLVGLNVVDSEFASATNCTFLTTVILTRPAYFTACAFEDTTTARANVSFADCAFNNELNIELDATCHATGTTFITVLSYQDSTLDATDCEGNFFSNNRCKLTRCSGNAVVSNDYELIDCDFDELDERERTTIHVTSTLDSGDGTLLAAINAANCSKIICDVAARCGAVTISNKDIEIIGAATFSGAVSFSGSYPRTLRATNVTFQRVVGGSNAYVRLDRCDVTGATNTGVIIMTASSYSYATNCAIYGNRGARIAGASWSFSHCTFAGNYSSSGALLSATGEKCVAQSTNSDFVVAPPTTAPATIDTSTWNLELLPTSQYASVAPSLTYDRKGRPRKSGVGAFDAVRVAETGKTKAFYDNGWKDATNEPLSDLTGVTDFYVDSASLTGTFGILHAAGAVSVAGSCSGVEMGLDAAVSITGAAGEVDYIGGSLTATSATIRNKINPLSVATVASATLINCVETENFTGTALTISGGSYHADSLEVGTADLNGDVEILDAEITSGTLRGATFDTLIVNGAVSSTGAIAVATVNGTLTIDGATVGNVALYGKLIVDSTTTLGLLSATNGEIDVASTAILRVETCDPQSTLTATGFVAFPVGFDLTNLEGDRVMTVANISAASAEVDYDSLALTFSGSGTPGVEYKSNGVWTLLGFDDEFSGVPSEGVFDLRVCDGQHFIELKPARWYYYVGGDEGSFAEPTDWTLDAEHDHACTVAPTIDGCIFDCRRNGN